MKRMMRCVALILVTVMAMGCLVGCADTEQLANKAQDALAQLNAVTEKPTEHTTTSTTSATSTTHATTTTTAVQPPPP